MIMVKFISVILLMMATEASCTMYLIYTEKRKAFKAGVWCSATILFTSLAVVNYVEDRSLIIAAVIGAFLGSYLITKFNKNKES